MRGLLALVAAGAWRGVGGGESLKVRAIYRYKKGGAAGRGMSLEGKATHRLAWKSERLRRVTAVEDIGDVDDCALGSVVGDVMCTCLRHMLLECRWPRLQFARRRHCFTAVGGEVSGGSRSCRSPDTSAGIFSRCVDVGESVVGAGAAELASLGCTTVRPRTHPRAL